MAIRSCDLCMQEKVDAMEVLGADVRLVPAVPFTDPKNYNHQVRGNGGGGGGGSRREGGREVHTCCCYRRRSMLRHWTMLCGLTSLTTEQIGKLITKPQDLRSGSRQVRTYILYQGFIQG